MKLNRENKLIIGLCTAAAILIAKLFSIQILDDKYKMDAENNSMVYSTIYPTRGIIHDNKECHQEGPATGKRIHIRSRLPSEACIQRPDLRLQSSPANVLPYGHSVSA